MDFMSNPFTDITEALFLCSTNKIRETKVFLKFGSNGYPKPILDCGLLMMVGVGAKVELSFVLVNALPQSSVICF